MKENRTANALGDGGDSDANSTVKKRVAYGMIIALLLFAIVIQAIDIPLPPLEIDKIAQIASWYNGSSTDEGGAQRDELLPDVEVRIFDVGPVRNGEYRPDDTITGNDTALVRIAVTNIGDTASAAWSIEASLPSKEPFIYSKDDLRPLNVDEERVYRLSFDALKEGVDLPIVIHVLHPTPESSDKNNTAIKRIDVY